MIGVRNGVFVRQSLVVTVDEVVVAMHVRNLDSGEWAQKTLNQKQFLTQLKIFRLFFYNNH
jgi:hypothetical protein